MSTSESKLNFKPDGEIRTFFYAPQTKAFFTDFQPIPKAALVQYPNGEHNRISCWLFEGLITTPEWANTHHVLQLELERSGDQLQGIAKALQTNTQREGQAASFYVLLSREEQQKERDR